MNPELTQEQQQALDRNHGLVEGPSYVLMSIDMYREMVQTSSEHAESTDPQDQDSRNGDSSWSELKNARRCDLIDKEIEGIITAEEQKELEILQREAIQFRDRIAPPRIEGARALHRELLAAKRRNR